jgi:hypothetical protein
MLEILGSTLESFDRKLRIVVPNELLGFKNVYKKLGKELGKFDTKKALDIQGLSEQKRHAFEVLYAGREFLVLQTLFRLYDIFFQKISTTFSNPSRKANTCLAPARILKAPVRVP